MARFKEIDEEAFEKARIEGIRVAASIDRAISARYDAINGKLVVGLASGRSMVFDPVRLRSLRTASVAELEEVSIGGYGDTLSFKSLDADFAVSRLIELFGRVHALVERP